MKPWKWIDLRPDKAFSPSHCDAWMERDGYPHANYWLTGQPNQGGRFYLDLGCVAEVIGFRVTNTHNYVWNDYSTKDFRIWLRNWEYHYPEHKGAPNINQIHKDNALNKWTEVLKATLPDARWQVGQTVYDQNSCTSSCRAVMWRCRHS